MRQDVPLLLIFQQTLDVDAEINAVNVDLSGVEVFPASLQTQMDDLRAAVNISFQEFYDEVRKYHFRIHPHFTVFSKGDNLLRFRFA